MKLRSGDSERGEASPRGFERRDELDRPPPEVMPPSLGRTVVGKPTDRIDGPLKPTGTAPKARTTRVQLGPAHGPILRCR